MRILLAFIFSIGIMAKPSVDCPFNKMPVCHAGSNINPNYVDICIDFAGLFGHFGKMNSNNSPNFGHEEQRHEPDRFGKCQVEEIKGFSCNAGLRHVRPNSQLCYNRIDGSACLPNECEIGQTCNCVCAGSNPQWPSDFIRYKFSSIPGWVYSEGEIIKDLFELLSPITFQERVKQAGEFDYNEVTDNPFYTLLDNEGSLSFNLGSTRIGSEYFVDTCWYHPAKEAPSTAHKITTSLTETSSIFNNANSYLPTVNAQSRIEVFCGEDEDLSFEIPMAPIYSTAYTPFYGGQKNYNVNIDDSNFCLVRHFIKEIEQDFTRPWDLKRVSLQAETKVSPLEQTPDIFPMSICHLKPKVGPGRKQYTCQQLYFQDQEDYVIYIQQYNNVNDWRQDHNHDYRGICEKPDGEVCQIPTQL